jgi:hypothetical protein
MHLGPAQDGAFVRQVLDAGSYVVCHDTLTYGDFPPLRADDLRVVRRLPLDRARDLLLLQAARRLTEVPLPAVAAAEEPGRAAGKAEASRACGGSTPEGACQRVLLGAGEGDPAVPAATGPPAIGPAAGYTEDNLARELGIEPGDRALPRVMSACADALTSSFSQETGRAAGKHAG